MSDTTDLALDHLLKEYSTVFRELDDATLARWLCQTLGQLQGRAWRFSHPLLEAYRLAAHVAQERQIWLKRLATVPPAYTESPCCRAPMLPLFARDVLDGGLLCHHCGEICVPFEEMPHDLQQEIRKWADQYASLHEVAHWDDERRKASGNYTARFQQASLEARHVLETAAKELVPRLLEFYPAVVWTDGDECLEINPQDLQV